MTTQTTAPPAAPAKVEVSWHDRSVLIREEPIFRHPQSPACETFLRRVLDVPGIRSVELEPPNATALIRIDPAKTPVVDLLDQLARAIRGAAPSSVSGLTWILPRDFGSERVTVSRVGPYLTTWDVACDQPGRLRLRNRSVVADPAILHRLERRFEHVQGILEFRVRPLTGSLLIRFDPNRTSTAEVLRWLDAAARAQPDTLSSQPDTNPSPAVFGLANSSLVLAAAGEFFLPILRPVSALLLLALNVDTLKTAVKLLGNKRLGLSSLYSAIVVVTLASGQFLASSLMGWMIVFWNHKFASRLSQARRVLLGEVLPQPLFVRRVAPGHVEVEVSIDQLQPDDLILITSGETIPADGRIDQGRGLVDERTISGSRGLSRRGPGDAVFAGSLLLSGELEVRVKRVGTSARASALAGALYRAASLRRPGHDDDSVVHPLAHKAITPALATAGIGFLFVDVVTAAAVLRPEYNTGLSLSGSLESLESIAVGLHHGIVIRDAAAIARLREADLLLLDAHPIWQRPDIQVAGVSASPGCTESELLAYAEAALRDLDDPRAVPLRTACRTLKVSPLRDRPISYQPDITTFAGGRRVMVGNYGSNVTSPAISRESAREPGDPPPDTLMVGVDNKIAGLIHFRRGGHDSGAAAIRRLRAKNPALKIAITSDLSRDACLQLAQTLELEPNDDDVLIGHDRARFLEWADGQGLKTALVADRRVVNALGNRAYVCIAFDDQGSADLSRHTAPFVLLQPDLARLTDLWDIARAQARASHHAQWTTLVPNLLCVAGAFLLGFTSMASVVLTNLGTCGLYIRTSKSLKKLEHHASRKS